LETFDLQSPIRNRPTRGQIILPCYDPSVPPDRGIPDGRFTLRIISFLSAEVPMLVRMAVWLVAITLSMLAVGSVDPGFE
jgi:hypothetical protein